MKDEKKEPEFKDYPFIHLEIRPYPENGNDIYVMRVIDKECPLNCAVVFGKAESLESQLEKIIILAEAMKSGLKDHQRK
jgi:hypothetical protein